jgi:hypothetical protein
MFSNKLQNERREYRPRFVPKNVGLRFKGGGKNAASDAADAARADETERQNRIREGTQKINDTFGGTSQYAPATSYDPNQTYNSAQGTPYDPSADTPGMFTMPGAKDAVYGDPNNLLKEGKLFQKGPATGGFDDTFYKGREQAYLDYANPQLEQQYGDATKQLTFALSRNGLLDSSVRAQRSADLTRDYDTQRQGIASKALDYSNQARNQVEQSRQGLVQTLNATGDAQGAAQSAITEASNLSQPPAFDPLSNLFLNATQGLATQADLERRGEAKFNTGLFNRGKSSSTVVS